MYVRKVLGSTTPTNAPQHHAHRGAKSIYVQSTVVSANRESLGSVALCMGYGPFLVRSDVTSVISACLSLCSICVTDCARANFCEHATLCGIWYFTTYSGSRQSTELFQHVYYGTTSPPKVKTSWKSIFMTTTPWY
jgi:hypothetical protein